MRRRVRAKAKAGSEVGDLERRLAEALEQQAATSAILRVISQSPTDVQPVFDAIIQNAVRLSGAIYGTVYRLDGETVHSVAQHNFTPEQAEEWRQIYPRQLSNMPGRPGESSAPDMSTEWLILLPRSTSSLRKCWPACARGTFAAYSSSRCSDIGGDRRDRPDPPRG